MKYDYMTADPALYPLLKEFARENRKHQTEAEAILWEILRSKHFGVIFKRQHIIGDFIADFICLEKRLIIEVDGGYHSQYEQIVYDNARTEWLNRQGFRVLRIKNEEIINNYSQTIKLIEKEL